MRKLLLTLWLCLLPALAGAQPVIPQTTASAAISVSTNGTVQLVAAPTLPGPGGTLQAIYVTNWNVIAGGTTNVQLVSGTGTNCGTGQANVTGNYPLTAQVGLVVGSGEGVVLAVPAGKALCITTSGGSVAVAGSISYGVF